MPAAAARQSRVRSAPDYSRRRRSSSPRPAVCWRSDWARQYCSARPPAGLGLFVATCVALAAIGAIVGAAGAGAAGVWAGAAVGIGCAAAIFAARRRNCRYWCGRRLSGRRILRWRLQSGGFLDIQKQRARLGGDRHRPAEPAVRPSGLARPRPQARRPSAAAIDAVSAGWVSVIRWKVGALGGAT